MLVFFDPCSNLVNKYHPENIPSEKVRMVDNPNPPAFSDKNTNFGVKQKTKGTLKITSKKDDNEDDFNEKNKNSPGKTAGCRTDIFFDCFHMVRTFDSWIFGGIWRCCEQNWGQDVFDLVLRLFFFDSFVCLGFVEGDCLVSFIVNHH